LDICAFGSVSRELQEEVAAGVSECYARLDVLLPSVVALRFFDTVKRQQVEHERERRMLAPLGAGLGVVSGGGDPLPVGHSAWGDMPRITICVERLEPLPGLLRQGMVHVAAAHAVLHGSADYYLFQIPAAIVREGQETGIGSVLLQQLLYQVATAVKGNGAVRLLVSHGFIADQVALAMHQLEVTADDLLAWQLARADSRGRALYLMAQLRPLLSAQPLLVHAPVLAEAMHGLTGHLPSAERERLLGLSARITAALSGDTRADIERAFSLAWDQLVRRESMD
jgi:hypothetical protein